MDQVKIFDKHWYDLQSYSLVSSLHSNNPNQVPYKVWISSEGKVSIKFRPRSETTLVNSRLTTYPYTLYSRGPVLNVRYV